MTWKKHPGIWFTLYALETMFFLGILAASLQLSHTVKNSIIFAWDAFMFYGMVYYHARWIEKKMN